VCVDLKVSGLLAQCDDAAFGAGAADQGAQGTGDKITFAESCPSVEFQDFAFFGLVHDVTFTVTVRVCTLVILSQWVIVSMGFV
jgi:hypothetical protein